MSYLGPTGNAEDTLDMSLKIIKITSVSSRGH